MLTEPRHTIVSDTGRTYDGDRHGKKRKARSYERENGEYYGKTDSYESRVVCWTIKSWNKKDQEMNRRNIDTCGLSETNKRDN